MKIVDSNNMKWKWLNIQNKYLYKINIYKHLFRIAGLEPATCGFTAQRSAN